MDEQFSVVVGSHVDGDVVELTDVQIVQTGLGLQEALDLAARVNGSVLAPGALPA